MNETYIKVVNIIAEQFNIDASTLTENTKLREDLQADSISVMEMILTFEDTFNQTISDEDFDKIQTIGDVVNCIEVS